jgi:uncharacterized protein (TIGR00369 family)
MAEITASKVRDPDFVARTRDSFARQGFMKHIEARIVALDPGFCCVEAPFGDKVSQQHGYFHGGVVGALADNAGAYAGFTLLPSTATILTAEYKINLVAPALGEWLRASGKVVRSGRTLIVVSIDVHAIKADRQDLCAIASLTAIPRWDTPDAPVQRVST